MPISFSKSELNGQIVGLGKTAAYAQKMAAARLIKWRPVLYLTILRFGAKALNLCQEQKKIHELKKKPKMVI